MINYIFEQLCKKVFHIIIRAKNVTNIQLFYDDVFFVLDVTFWIIEMAFKLRKVRLS